MIKSLYKIPQIDGHSNLEIQIANGCNFTCQSCSHYTNVGGGKNLSLETCFDWMKNWNKRILPENFIIMGGEPTLNKDMLNIIILSSKMWNNSKIKLITNGSFLYKHPDLPKIMNDRNNIYLEISIKHDNSDVDYSKLVNSIKDLVNNWKSKYKINVSFREDYKHWLKLYHGHGKDILPFNDNNPELSYKECGSKVCRVLHEGNIWKCPRLAFLKLYKTKFNLDSSWDQYLEYKPLTPNCTNSELIKFFTEKHIKECSMCPIGKNYIKLDPPKLSPALLNIKLPTND